MESKALVKLTNSIVACRSFARTTSRILQMVNICEVVDLFLRKPFWFFLRMLSILGSMRLRSRALYILAAVDVSVLLYIWFIIVLVYPYHQTMIDMFE